MIRTSIVVAAAALLALPAVALAGPLEASDTNAVMKEQVMALVAGKPADFAATFSATAFLILPNAAGEAYGRAAIERAAKAWLGPTAPDSVAGDAPTCGDAGAPPTTGVAICTSTITVERKAGKTAYRVQFAVANLGGANLVVAEHISEGVPDPTAIALATAHELPALPELSTPDDQAGAVDVALDPQRIAAQTPDASDGVSLIGSAPGEVALGKRAVTAKLAAWKHLALDSTAFAFGHLGGVKDFDLVWVAAHVTATIGKAHVPYRALAIYAIDAKGARLEGASFSVATK